MRVHTFIQDDIGLVPIEVDLTLTAGLPQIRFLGLPDALIKESEPRIKEAIRNQGFEFPKSQQILVQLRPANIRKRSLGLDLAIAAAFLWETGQLNRPEGDVFLYGELDFNGRVRNPTDSAELEGMEVSGALITGTGLSRSAEKHLEISSLRDLGSPRLVTTVNEKDEASPPDIDGMFLGEKASRLAMIIGTGEHHALLAGPPGSGKTTFAEMIHASLYAPSEKEWRQAKQIARAENEVLVWRPLRRPHHTATSISIVGGGATANRGEITKAHGGVLLFDELLEFNSHVIDVMREPLERGLIHVSRVGRSVVHPARFLFLATTNFCPCGGFFPGRFQRCRCSLSRRRQYLQKLSGPLLDRFAILGLTHDWERENAVPLKRVREKIESARDFAKSTRDQRELNCQLDTKSLIEQVQPSALVLLEGDGISQRRSKFKVQVARSIADLEHSEVIRLEHLSEADELCVRSLLRMQSDFLKEI